MDCMLTVNYSHRNKICFYAWSPDDAPVRV